MVTKSKRYLLIGVSAVLGFIGVVLFSISAIFIAGALTIKEWVDDCD